MSYPGFYWIGDLSYIFEHWLHHSYITGFMLMLSR